MGHGQVGRKWLLQLASAPPTFQFFSTIFFQSAEKASRGQGHQPTTTPNEPGQAAAERKRRRAASNRPLSSAASTDHGHGRLLPAAVGVPRRRLPQDLHLPQGLLHWYISLPPLRRHLVLGCVACRFLRSGAWDHGSLLLLWHDLVILCA